MLNCSVGNNEFFLDGALERKMSYKSEIRLSTTYMQRTFEMTARRLSAM